MTHSFKVHLAGRFLTVMVAAVSLAPVSLNAQSLCVDIFSGQLSHQIEVSNASIEWTRVQSALPKGSRVIGRVRTGKFLGQTERTQDLRMAFDVVRPLRESLQSVDLKPTVILLQGISDARQNLDLVTNEFLRNGFPVLRVDLLGHGQTSLLNQNPATPQAIDPYAQVDMVVGLTTKLDIKRTIVVGHSMGGGLSILVSRQLKTAGIDVVANVPVAPYISSVDKFLMSRSMTPEVIEQNIENFRERTGLATIQGIRKKIYEAAPFGAMVYSRAQSIASYWNSTWQAVLARSLNPIISLYDANSKSINKAIDTVLDPVVLKFMRSQFEEYLNLKSEQLPKRQRPTEEETRVHVEGAINSMIGMRDIDFQNRVHPTEVDGTIPMLIISGKNDDLVTPAQVSDFEALAKQSKYNLTIREIDSNHFIPQLYPKEVVTEVMEFLKSIE